MSGIVASSEQLSREAEGEMTLELVAIRYTGSRTVYPVQSHLAPDAEIPTGAPLDGGPTPEANGSWRFLLTPDSGLSHLEGRPDIEVVYAEDRAAFAEALLEQNRLPDNAFGRGADRRIQDRLMDALGLKPAVEAGPLEVQLREIAGLEEPDEADEEPEKSTVKQIADDYTRDELGDICKELRESTDAFNLRDNASKLDRAEYIASHDADERKRAIDTAVGGSE